MFNDIIHENHYQGIPLATEHGPFLEIRLSDSLTTIENIMSKSRRIIVFCMEVLVPVSCGMGSSLYGDPVPQFVAKLQKQARWKHTELHGQKTRLHVPIIDGIWQEVMTPQGRTGYRIMLLLNREAYDEQSIGFDAANTLQYRARMAWAKVMCQWRSKSVPLGRSKSVPVGTRWFDVFLAEVRSGAARNTSAAR